MSTVQVRETFAKDTPSTWKGSTVISGSNVPSTGTGLQHANVIKLFSAQDLEYRERRLALAFSGAAFSNATASGYALNAPSTRAGFYFVTNPPPNVTPMGSAGRFNLGLRMTCYPSRLVLLCDAKSGVYRVPPSTEISVDLIVSRPSTSNFISPFSVDANLTDDGSNDQVIRPTQSAMFSILGAQAFDFYLNPLTRWLDTHANVPTFGIAANPVLTLSPNTGFGASILRDYVNNAWFPTGDPVEVFGTSASASGDPQEYHFSNTDTCDCVITQFLEW